MCYTVDVTQCYLNLYVYKSFSKTLRCQNAHHNAASVDIMVFAILGGQCLGIRYASESL